MIGTRVNFTRLVLSALVEEFKADPDKDVRKVRVMRDADVVEVHPLRGHWEFYGRHSGPADGFKWHGLAHDAYDARQQGWSAWRRAKQKAKEQRE